MKTVRLLFGMMLVFFMAFAPMDAKAHDGHRGRHGVYTPHWVPGHMIRANVRHVYFPSYDVYFDRYRGVYIYLNYHGRWVASTYLPYYLRRVNFARAYKVGLYVDTPRPYVYNHRHRVKYRKYHRNRNGYRNGHHRQGQDNRRYRQGDWDDDRNGNGRRGDGSGGRREGQRQQRNRGSY